MEQLQEELGWLVRPVSHWWDSSRRCLHSQSRRPYRSCYLQSPLCCKSSLKTTDSQVTDWMTVTNSLWATPLFPRLIFWRWTLAALRLRRSRSQLWRRPKWYWVHGS